MRVRILSEWAGSPRCGVVADVPDALAMDRIRSGFAEAVPPSPGEDAAPPHAGAARVPSAEAAVVSSPEVAVAVKPKRGRR